MRIGGGDGSCSEDCNVEGAVDGNIVFFCEFVFLVFCVIHLKLWCHSLIGVNECDGGEGKRKLEGTDDASGFLKKLKKWKK